MFFREDTNPYYGPELLMPFLEPTFCTGQSFLLTRCHACRRIARRMRCDRSIGKMLPQGQNSGSGVALTPSETASYSMLQCCTNSRATSS